MAERARRPRLGYAAASWALLLVSLAALAAADLDVSALHPWTELARLSMAVEFQASAAE